MITINLERYKKALTIIFLLFFLGTSQFILKNDLKEKTQEIQIKEIEGNIPKEVIIKDKIIKKRVEVETVKTPFILKELEEFTIEAFSKDKESRKNAVNKRIMSDWEGVNVAVDPNIIPYGTKIYIPGIGIRQTQPSPQLVEGKKVLVYFSNTEDKENFEVKDIKIYEVVE